MPPSSPPLDEDPPAGADRRRRSPLQFLALLFVLSVPFWLVGRAVGRHILPGLPVSALQAVCPVIAASILVYRECGAAGVVELLRRSLDYRRIRAKAWYAPILLPMPGLALLSYALMRLAGLSPHVTPASVPMATGMLLAFLLSGLAEELGWSGYLTDPVQSRMGALRAGILMGLAWAAWHAVPLLQAQRPPGWIAGWVLLTVALRVLIVWVYNNTGRSVFAASLLHATSNVCAFALPGIYDPRFLGPATAVAAAAVARVWGPRTLAERRQP